MAQSNGKKSSGGKVVFIILLIVVIAFVITYFVCSIVKNDGEQAGVLLNFGKKGVIVKTYEGELNKGGVGNVANTAQFNESFKFSVVNQAAADSLMKLNGEKVSVHFKEVVHAFFWQGETNILVVGARKIQ